MYDNALLVSSGVMNNQDSTFDITSRRDASGADSLPPIAGSPCLHEIATAGWRTNRRAVPACSTGATAAASDTHLAAWRVATHARTCWWKRRAPDFRAPSVARSRTRG